MRENIYANIFFYSIDWMAPEPGISPPEQAENGQFSLYTQLQYRLYISVRTHRVPCDHYHLIIIPFHVLCWLLLLSSPWRCYTVCLFLSSHLLNSLNTFCTHSLRPSHSVTLSNNWTPPGDSGALVHFTHMPHLFSVFVVVFWRLQKLVDQSIILANFGILFTATFDFKNAKKNFVEAKLPKVVLLCSRISPVR